ncbi:MAG: T9SS type A sorting domain-containing protein [Caldithrix sp.]|nr:T9SS type A sorting domain-containing protein [Caldithrix sp.]
MKCIKILLIFYVFMIPLVAQENTSYYHGVQTHFGQYKRADMDSASVINMLDSVKSAGIQLIRDECYWTDVERDTGVYEFPWQIDFYIEEARRRGIEILLILNYNNPHYAAHSSFGIENEINREAFVNYCVETVKRYAPLGVKYYEIWNEPNIPMFWSPEPHAGNYGALLQAVYPAIKAVDSTVTVLGCATSPAEGEPLPAIDWLSFIEGVYNSGGGDYMDGVSVHFYRFGAGPETWLANDINVLQNIIGVQKPVWITEVGYPTSSVWPYVSLQEQAAWLSRLYLLGRNIESLQSVTYYDLKNDGTEADNNEHNFGLMNYNLFPKPAYFAVRTEATLTGNKSLVSTEAKDDRYVYTFANDQDSLKALWCTSGVVNDEVAIFTGRMEVWGMTGQVNRYLYNRDGAMTINFEEQPQYVRPVSAFPPIESLILTETIDTLVVGQQVALNLMAQTEESRPIIIDDGSCIEWQISGSIGEVDSTGTFKAMKAGEGTLTGLFEGATFQQTITILPAYEYLEIEPFNSKGRFNTFTAGIDSLMLSIEDSNYTSADHALAVNYKMTYESSRAHRVYFDCEYTLYGEPDSLLLDVFNNGNEHYLKFYLTDEAGEEVLLDIAYLQSARGWQTVSVPLSGFGDTYKYPVRLTRFMMHCVQDEGQRDQVYTGQIMLDNLRIHGQETTGLLDHRMRPVKHFKLHQNYPNPFNNSTTISFAIPVTDLIRLSIYNILGQKVATLINREMEAGTHHVNWKASSVSSGVYFYRLKTGSGWSHIRKLVLVK